MKNLFILLVCVLSFFGCQNVQQPEKPKNLIPKDKMVDILTESYMTNAARSVNNQFIIESGVNLDSLVYKNFGVDSLQFAKSNAYYAADINSYLEIVENVKSRLTAMQKELDSLRMLERKTTDTLIERAEDRGIAVPMKQE